MPRPRGRRNPDFARKRDELSLAISRALLDADGMPSSFAALANAAGVTVPTLRHYFGDYDGAFRAGLDAAERGGAPHLARARDPGDSPLAQSMHEFARSLIEGWKHGVGAIFAGALVHGLSNPARGTATVDHVLEPTLQALERRLAVHAQRGELRDATDPRTAALSLAAPIVLALLHQRELSGSRCRPLDIDGFVEAHLEGWLRAWRR